MSQPRLARTGSLGALCLGALILSSARARASESVDQCLAAYEAGQELRRAGDLVESAEQLRTCGGPACPVRMQADCQRWLDDVERATPAVVFRVRDARGALLANASISIDGAPARRLDGRALAMNPGDHEVVFERDGYQTLRTPVFVTEGEKLERREVTLADLVSLERDAQIAPDPGAAPGLRKDGIEAEESSAPPMLRPHSAWPLVLGGVGLAGAAGFVFFGVRAQSGEADLEQCTPNCTHAAVDDVKQDYLLSNLSLGIGLGGLIGAGLWLLLDRTPADGSGASPRHAVQVGSAPRWVVRF
jgi:hypothetical protein